jgi:hypothetical protein
MANCLLQRKIDEKGFGRYENLVWRYEKFIAYKQSYTILAKDILLLSHNP